MGQIGEVAIGREGRMKFPSVSWFLACCCFMHCNLSCIGEAFGKIKS